MAAENAPAGEIREDGQDADVSSLTDLLTVTQRGGVKAAVVTFCNRSTAATIRLSVAKLGAADDNSQYKLYDFPLAANGTFEFVVTGLNYSDVIRVKASTANVTATLNGIFY